MFPTAERLLLSSLLSWLHSRASIPHTPAAKPQLSTLPGMLSNFFCIENIVSCTDSKKSSGVSKELQQRRISVNAVAPGPMDTREFTFFSI